MVMSKSVRTSLGMVLALAAFWGSACSSGSSPRRHDADDRPSGPRLASGSTAHAVEGFVSAIGGAYGRAVGPQATSASPAATGTTGADRFGAASIAAASCDSVALTYFNAQGQQQPTYDPATTTRIGAKGPCSTPQGVVTLDATADDAQASSSTVLINGTAQGTYEGYNVQAVVTNVRMTKQFCGAPASGVVVATTNGLVGDHPVRRVAQCAGHLHLERHRRVVHRAAAAVPVEGSGLTAQGSRRRARAQGSRRRALPASSPHRKIPLPPFWLLDSEFC